MYSHYTLPEVFDAVRKGGTVEERASILAKYDNKQLRWFVDVMYNADLQGLVLPEYEPSVHPVGSNFITATSVHQNIEVALRYKADPDKADLVERKLLIVLENMDKDEAELYFNMLSGSKVEGVSKAVFKRVYPFLFQESDSEDS